METLRDVARSRPAIPAPGFDGLADQLAALGRTEDAAQCRRFADRGALTDDVAPASIAPAHADTTPRAGVLRNVIAICCLGETVAGALFGADTTSADEIGPARFGWLFVARELADLTPKEHDAIARYLPVAFGHLEAAANLLGDGRDARFYETVTDVIVPQLEAHGLPAARAWQHRRTA